MRVAHWQGESLLHGFRPTVSIWLISFHIYCLADCFLKPFFAVTRTVTYTTVVAAAASSSNSQLSNATDVAGARYVYRGHLTRRIILPAGRALLKIYCPNQLQGFHSAEHRYDRRTYTGRRRRVARYHVHVLLSIRTIVYVSIEPQSSLL